MISPERGKRYWPSRLGMQQAASENRWRLIVLAKVKQSKRVRNEKTMGSIDPETIN